MNAVATKQICRNGSFLHPLLGVLHFLTGIWDTNSTNELSRQECLWGQLEDFKYGVQRSSRWRDLDPFWLGNWFCVKQCGSPIKANCHWLHCNLVCGSGHLMKLKLSNRNTVVRRIAAHAHRTSHAISQVWSMQVGIKRYILLKNQSLPI